MLKLLAGALAFVLLSPLSGAASQSLFYGFYDSAPQNPTDHIATMVAHEPFTNATGIVRVWSEAEWATAKALNLKVIVAWPYEMFLTVDVNRPLDLQMDMGWWAQTGIRTPADWINIINRHRDQVAFVGVSDEYGCGTRYPDWLANTTNCRNAAAKIEAVLAEARLYLPGLQMHVNETSQFASFFAVPDSRRWWLDMFGIRLSSADYVGFDCYTDFLECARTGTEILSVPVLVGHLKRFMASTQQIALIPRAFAGVYLGYNVPDESVAYTLRQYEDLARSDPRVGAVLPFIFFDLFGPGTGAGSRPVIMRQVEATGYVLTGKLPRLPDPPAAVTGLKIVRD